MELTGKWKCGSSVIDFSSTGNHSLKLKESDYYFTVLNDSLIEVSDSDGMKTKYKISLNEDKLSVFFEDAELIYKKK